MSNLQDWQDEQAKNSSITVEQLDKLSNDFKEAKLKYEEAKTIYNGFYAEMQTAQTKMVEALEQAGKTKYLAEGVGTFYFIDKVSVKVPKDTEEKKKLFNFLLEKYGEVVYWDKVNIHSASLNALYNEELEEHNRKVQAGEAEGDFHIPGLEAPTSNRTLGFRTERKK